MKRSAIAALLVSCALAGAAQGQVRDSWATYEALLWWAKDAPVPAPLATAAPANTPAFIPGAIGQPGTTVVLGGSEVDYGQQFGQRITLGHWSSTAPAVGCEASFMHLLQREHTDTVSNNGTSFLANPFRLPGFPLPVVNYLATPGGGNAGTATLTAGNEIYGCELNGLFMLTNNGRQTWSLIAGTRFLNIHEELALDTTQQDDLLFFPGQFANTRDEFDTQNYFVGGQLGLRGEMRSGMFFVSTTIKLGLGNVHEVLRVSGSTTTNTGPFFLSKIPVTTVPGGIYAQPTNIGTHHSDRFAVLPEVALRVGAQFSSGLRLFVGYDFLYLSDVVRPGEQIDDRINPTQLISFTGVGGPTLVGPRTPAPRFVHDDFWAQGLSLGAELVY